MMEILNINDVTNVNLTLESLSQIHFDKLRYGRVKADFLNFDHSDTDTFFTEDQKSFLSLFMASLRPKRDFGLGKKEGDEGAEAEEIPKNSLFETPQHLLFAQYLLVSLKAREKKTQLLYTLNAFRSIQKRITLELLQQGSRDRVVDSANIIKPLEKSGVAKAEDIEHSEELSGDAAARNMEVENGVGAGASDI